MNKVTKLMAALALLMFLIPITGWGQAPVNTTLWEETWTGGAANTTPSNYEFSGTTVYGGATLTYAQSSTSTKLYDAALAGGTTPELLLAKSNTTWTISGIPSGSATGLTLTFKANYDRTEVSSTTTGITIGTKSFSDNTVTYPITVASTVSTFTLVFTNTTSSNVRIDDIELVVTTAGGGTPTPTITLSDSGTGNIGNYAVNTEISRTFTVSQSDLTEGITLTATNGGTLTPNSIEQGAGTTEVTWNFTTPETPGQFTSTITATSGETSATCTYLGYAFTPHNVNIATMEHGTVMADPNSAIEGTYVTLTWTPDQGYELGELTIVDANNSPVSYSDFVTYYRFQMPDSDVTVSATFVEAGATTIVTDELTNSNTINDPNATTYTSWATTGVSGAAYSGQSAGSNNTIQLRSNNSNSGIVSTTSGGNIKKVTIDWYDGTAAGRTLSIYGSNTAYTDPTDLYNANNQGTLLGTIVKGTSTELTVSGNYAYIGLRSASGAMYLNKIDIDWAVSGTPAPFISADPVEIAYNVTSGSIMYEIENYVAGTMVATTSADWISDFTYEQVDEIGEVGFTATVNPTGIARTATVTLTYTYGDSQTATKNVTVTQTGNPNVVDNISDITEVGVQYAVRGTVVATNSRGFIIGDGTGYVYTYLNAAPTQSVGDIVSISGTTGQYGHIIQFTSSATIAEATESNYNGEPEYTVITEVPDYSEGYHLSDYFQFEGTLSKAINNNYTNYNIAVGEGTIRISYPTDDQVTALEDLLDKTVRVHGFFAGISGTTFTAMMESIEEVVAAEPSITLVSNDPAFTPNSPYTIEFTHESGGGTSIDQVQCENFSNTLTVDDFSILYCDAEGNALESQEAPVWFLSAPSVTSESNNFYLGVTVDSNPSTTSRTYYFKVGAANVYSDLVTVYQAGYVATITVDPTVVNATAAETDGTITVTYTNIDFTNAPEIVFYSDAEGTMEVEASYYANWFQAEINNDNNVDYLIGANDGEARTAYFKVYGLDIYVQEVYSDLVTVNQAEYAVDYATLPFEFDGGRADIETTNGLTQEGLDSDYNSSPKLKFNTTGDWLLLHFNEVPGTLTFDIKNNSFSGGTFTVQTSEDGVTFTDLENYTSITGTQSEEFDNLGENVRYIKWIYTNKSSGNVGLGNITLAKYVEPVLVPSITVDPDMVEVNAEEHDGTLDLTYENLTITEMDDFGIQYYDAEGEELTEDPEWIEVLVAEQDPQEGEGYVVSYYMLENEGEARSAYFKVFAADGEDFVYSNLVTVSQAAPEVPFTGTTYTLATTIESGRHYIITNGSDRAMGGQGNNNRAAVEINTVENVAQVDSDDVVELVINGPDANGFYTIYDANVPGYLYAAGGTSSNHLKTQTFCDNKGQWTISFDAETSAASIMANISDNNARNTMRYNSNSDIFSCYSGGQQAVYLYLKDEETPQYDFYKDIAGYGQAENGNYYLIASPIDDADPVAAGMITDELGAQATPETSTYDLYWFDQTQDEEWQNYRQGTFKLASGMGYLYANKENKTIHFDGTPYDGDGSVSLVKDDEANFSGWNLVGNPFGVSAYIDRPFYVMNQDGTELIQSNANDEIAAMQGIFVIANEDGENLTFTPEATDQSANLTLNLSQSRGAVIDRATVSFNDGRQLPKFQLNAESTKLYIPQGNNDYSVVNSNAQGEMPVNFKAQNNGTYTISVNTENLEANYLHLIDNMTGTNIDLLQTPSYTFEAKTTDYASRFRLVFNVTGVEENTTSTEPFAFFNGSEWVVSNMGEATLQVVDMLGRIVSSETVNGNATMTTANLGAGVYVMRLVNGENVKIQKIIIK